MLTDLKVSNFAIIDQINVQFADGFNVLSGETGSGKSVLLKSLSLLMGGKSTSDVIKTGTKEAIVEGAFDISHRTDIQDRLEAFGISSDDEQLIVRRILSPDGKNRVYLNGSLATLTQLKEVVSPLVEVTGRSFDDGTPLTPLIEMTAQHENRNLQSKLYHLDLLDEYLGLIQLRNDYRQSYQELCYKQEELESLLATSKEKNQRLDFLIYQRDEIKELNLQAGEELELENNLELLRNSEKLEEFFAEAESTLYSSEDSVLERLHHLQQKANQFSHLNDNLQNWSQNLQQAKALLDECVYEVRNMGGRFNHDEESLAQAEERMSAIRKLQKKFGQSTEQILAELESIEKEITDLENSEFRVDELQSDIKKLENKLNKQANELHQSRTKGSTTLVDSVNSELTELNMKGVIFGIEIIKSDDLSSTGCTEVQFTIQASKKDTARPLAKFASGGELSRILLSLKRVVGHSDQPRTYLFDEVDAGVSGLTAEKVGRKLKSISKGQQVICVTHLPQVAAFADSHYVISKDVSKSKVSMHINKLSAIDRIEEVARMISGEKVTKTGLVHAKELIAEAK